MDARVPATARTRRPLTAEIPAYPRPARNGHDRACHAGGRGFESRRSRSRGVSATAKERPLGTLSREQMVVYAGLDASSGSPRAIFASTSKYAFLLESPSVAST